MLLCINDVTSIINDAMPSTAIIDRNTKIKQSYNFINKFFIILIL